MSEAIRVEICAPERAKVVFKAQEVLCPGEDGLFTVRYGHTPLLTTLVPGVLVVVGPKNEEHFFALSGGFAEVEPDRVLVLADTFEDGDDVDAARAQAAVERAEMRLQKPDEDTDLQRAEMALYRAAARLKASQHSGY